MNDYNDPNELWTQEERKFYEELNDEERIAAAILRIVYTCITLLVAVLLCALLSGCTITKYVPMPEVHTEHHWHTDSVKERDSIHTENTTIIRELDSAEMAKYGIHMQNNQRAWLVFQREMEQRLRELEHMIATRDTIHDSIPAPYPVEKIVEVDKPLTWWQKTLMWLGVALIAIIAVWIWRTK